MANQPPTPSFVAVQDLALLTEKAQRLQFEKALSLRAGEITKRKIEARTTIHTDSMGQPYLHTAFDPPAGQLTPINN